MVCIVTDLRDFRCVSGIFGYFGTEDRGADGGESDIRSEQFFSRCLLSESFRYGCFPVYVFRHGFAY